MPRSNERPAKPYKDFPLFPHRNGQWAKKIRGRFHYFGPWADWRAAVDLYQRQREDLHAGRTPVDGEGLELWQLVEAFLDSKEKLRDSGELSERSFDDYDRTCDRLVNLLGPRRVVAGMRPTDFELLRSQLAASLGPVALGNEINRIRMVFRHGWESQLLKSIIRFGPGFERPSAKTLRMHRAEQGPRLFTAEQLHQLVAAGKGHLPAMIMLGANAALGPADLGRLTWGRIGADGWLDYPRPKTGVGRRAWLWPETIERLPPRGEPSDLVFVTKYGSAWYREGVRDAPLSAEFRKLLDATGLYRRGLGFYTLRHTFATVAGESKDQVATDHVMGHAPSTSDMRACYRESISDERIQEVCEVVRRWFLRGAKVSQLVSAPNLGGTEKLCNM